MSRERPILFNGAMVRAILTGAKTQTRRAVKPQPFQASFLDAPGQYRPSFEDGLLRVSTPTGVQLLPCPFGQTGDRLWVRETFAIQCNVEDEDPPHSDGRPVHYRLGAEYGYRWSQAHYRATDPAADLTCDVYGCAQCRDHDMGPHWRPSIHMPRWACRLVLEITAVRVERLQAMPEADWEAEGISFCMEDPSTAAGHAFNEAEHYAIAGVSMRGTPEDHGMRAQFAEQGLDWDSNPWVWVIEFKQVTP